MGYMVLQQKRPYLQRRKTPSVNSFIFAFWFWSNESEGCSVMSNFLQPHGLPSSRKSPCQNTGVGGHSLLQWIFPTQGLNPGLPHCKLILYQLSHQGSPRILEWGAYPFSRGSFQSRNRTGVSCISGGFFTSWATREVNIQPLLEIHTWWPMSILSSVYPPSLPRLASLYSISAIVLPPTRLPSLEPGHPVNHPETPWLCPLSHLFLSPTLTASTS